VGDAVDGEHRDRVGDGRTIGATLALWCGTGGVVPVAEIASLATNGPASSPAPRTDDARPLAIPKTDSRRRRSRSMTRLQR
jgi:hypothetical protein